MTFALVVDRVNSKIRMINLLTYSVTALVTTTWGAPINIAWGGLQDLAIVTAFSDDKIDRVSSPSGTYAVIAGGGSTTSSNGVGTVAGIYGPQGWSNRAESCGRASRFDDSAKCAPRRFDDSTIR